MTSLYGVMMGWHGVWSQSEPRATPAGGPSLAKGTDSGWMPLHSQFYWTPGAEQGAKEVKLLFVFKHFSAVCLLNPSPITATVYNQCLETVTWNNQAYQGLAFCTY